MASVIVAHEILLQIENNGSVDDTYKYLFDEVKQVLTSLEENTGRSLYSFPRDLFCGY